MNAREGASGDLGRSSGQASGRHEGMQHPTGVDALEDRLQGDNPDRRGENVEDEIRDRHGKGAAAGYDDAVDAGEDERARGPQQSD